jgi:hypothetical protein
MRSLFILLCAIIIVSCSSKIEYIQRCSTATEIISIGEDEIIDDDLVQNADFIFLDNTYIIGEIGRMIFFDNKIFLHDNITDRVIVYTHDGNYLFHIDNKGRCPNEYLEIADFAIDRNSNSILIYDSKRHKILTYSIYSRSFTSEQVINFYPTKIACVDDLLYFYNPYTFNYPKNNKYHYSLISTSKNAKIRAKYFNVNTKIGNFLSNPNTQGFFYGDEITFLNRFESIIYKIDEDSVYASCMVDFFGNENFEKALLNAVDKGTRNTDLFNQYSTEITNYCETDKLIAFQYTRNELLYYVVYSKEDKNLLYHSSYLKLYSESLLIKNIPFFIIPQMSHENMFISILPSQLVESFVNNPKFNSEIKKNMSDELLISRFEDVKKDDNPILVMYSFNEKIN